MFAISSGISRVTRRTLSFSRKSFGLPFALLALPSLPACSNDYLTDGAVVFNTGQEADAWSVEPAAKRVVLEMVQDTKRTTLANVAAPVTSISLGTEGPQNTVASFEATAFDQDSNLVMKGTTVPLGILGFESAEIALFIGRVGGLSRAPGDLIFPWAHPQMAVLYHGYLLISGGDDASANLDVYDMARWVAAPKQTPLPTAPGSWAIAGSKLLIIDRTPSATWMDVTSRATTAVDAPVDLDYADIVGGYTVGGPGEPQYIVGATRSTGEPTNQVLRVDTDATLHLLKLKTPRLGAAATIVNGRLLVVGGSDTGAGAEMVNEAGTAFATLPFPPDATVGAAIVARDETTAVLAGGRDPANDGMISGFRSLDSSCAEDCRQIAIAGADFAFDHPRLFVVGTDQLLAVGEEPTTGETQVFTFDSAHTLNAFSLRTPRAGASAFMLPNGQVGVLGGYTLDDQTPVSSVELFFPRP
jgi:hypothetical protein